MKLLTTLSLCVFLAPAVIADLIPSTHSFHCDKWKNGKCIEGQLTKLSRAFSNQYDSSRSVAERSNTCERVCEEACPKCNYCDFCPFCAIYDDAACHDVPYFENRDTCSVSKTDSCCKLCEVQCLASEGACGTKGFCRNGTGEKGHDIISSCVEQTTEEECKPCAR